MADATPLILETGIPYLDKILGGGLLRRSLMMVVGAPGAGKTILVEQIAFHNAARGRPTLYLTGYSETHDKMITHSSGLDFFAPDQIGTGVQFASLLDLMREGEEETIKAIIATARAQKALLVVIDGFRGLRSFLNADRAVAHFLYSLGAQLGLLDATTIVVVEADPDAPALYPELTVCDIILGLQREVWVGHQRRRLKVLKARGSLPLLGPHAFVIDHRGIAISPRFESIVSSTDQPWYPGRAAFGIADLDAVIGGGPNVGTSTLAVGSLGVGKTTLGLHFIAEGIRAGESVLFLSSKESPDRLLEKARMLGMDLSDAIASGKLKILPLLTHDQEADEIAGIVVADVERRGVRRVVIDSVRDLERTVDQDGRASSYFTALLSYLGKRQVTTYLTLDFSHTISVELALAGTPLAALADNLLLLRQVEYQGHFHRVFSVFKMRFSAYESRIYELKITENRGVQVIGPAPFGEGLLTGAPQLRAEARPPLGNSEESMALP